MSGSRNIPQSLSVSAV
uniref:Uncharacterized protein n=1 Tax=Anguilla anguilla TaxID=7936 RepID=A0A0E9X9S9_ANGAN